MKLSVYALPYACEQMQLEAWLLLNYRGRQGKASSGQVDSFCFEGSFVWGVQKRGGNDRTAV